MVAVTRGAQGAVWRRRVAIAIGTIELVVIGAAPRRVTAQATPTATVTAHATATATATATAQPSPTPTATPTSIVTPEPGTSPEAGTASPTAATPRPSPSPIDPAAVNDPALRDVVRPKAPRAAIMRAQILLDRAHYSPGEIDAVYGRTVTHTIAAYQRAHGLAPSGEVDDATWTALDADTAPALGSYTLTAKDVAGPFAPIPTRMMEKAKLPALPYSSLLEELGEKFHVKPALITELNPGASIANAGDQIVVPAVGGKLSCDVREIVVSASDRSLSIVGTSGAVCARYPATTGSIHDPLPLGTWEVLGVGHNPTFHYNPHLFWDAPAGDRGAAIAPGPNNPIGVVWIDLSKEHYGIHGTPSPSTIGHTESHGCIRLTNWSAEQLSHLVRYGTTVLLEP
jgi:lipoprotein-anchoring transpeptidase ErfK/SrfK